MSYQGETALTSASTNNIPSSWDFPQNISTIFPKSDPDRLSGEGNYHVWAVRMENAFEVCGLRDIVNGAMARPSPGNVNEAVWLKMNASARTVIVQCISNNLVMKVSHFRDAKDIWTLFAVEYAQTGSSSIVYWFSRLSNPMQPTDDISAHVMAFQDAYRHLENSKFVIPESCAAGLLLSTLYKDPKDPKSWDHFIKGTCITETTTLSSVVNLLLQEKRRPSSGNMTVETAATAPSCSVSSSNRKWCRHCQRGGHTHEECRKRHREEEDQPPQPEQAKRGSGSQKRGRGSGSQQRGRGSGSQQRGRGGENQQRGTGSGSQQRGRGQVDGEGMQMQMQGAGESLQRGREQVDGEGERKRMKRERESSWSA